MSAYIHTRSCACSFTHLNAHAESLMIPNLSQGQNRLVLRWDFIEDMDLWIIDSLDTRKVEVCCSVLQCVAVCCNMVQRVTHARHGFLDY